MNYQNLEEYLLNIFNANNFCTLAANKNFHASKVLLNQQINLAVTFPGYKSYQKNNGSWVYDYRIDLNNIAISHTNIVVDLFNKCVQAPPTIRRELYKFLIDLSENALDVNLNDYPGLCNFNFTPPNAKLIESVSNTHTNLKKNYNFIGNSWNYSIFELLFLISYIVLQEDINYPMSKNLNGRRMSFYRYIEAMLCTLDNSYSLTDVIRRTLSHSRPILWSEYSKIYEPFVNLYRLLYL